MPELDGVLPPSALESLLDGPGRVLLAQLFPARGSDGLMDLEAGWPPDLGTDDEEAAVLFLGHLALLNAAISALEARRAAAAWRLSRNREMFRIRTRGPGAGELLPPERVAAGEIEAALAVPAGTAQRWVRLGRDLATKAQCVGEALATGAITARKATVMVDAMGQVDPFQAFEVEAEVLPNAHRRVPAQLADLTARAAIKANPEAAAEREQQARRTRRVTAPRPAGDGMASMGALLPAHQAAMVWETITAAATTAKCLGDSRSMANLRADALVEFVTTMPATGTPPGRTVPGLSFYAPATPTFSPAADGVTPAQETPPDLFPSRTGSDSGLRKLPKSAGLDPVVPVPSGVGAGSAGVDPVVPVPSGVGAGPAGLDPDMTIPSRVHAETVILVPLAALTADPNQMGLLAGGGPLTGQAVREIVDQASTRVRYVVTSASPDDPIRVQVAKTMGISPGTYKVPRALRALVQFMRQTCDNFLCPAPARHTDIEHRKPFGQGGPSTPDNLGCACRADHLLKTLARFRYGESPEGLKTISTHLGLTYTEPPPPPF